MCEFKPKSYIVFFKTYSLPFGCVLVRLPWKGNFKNSCDKGRPVMKEYYKAFTTAFSNLKQL